MSRLALAFVALLAVSISGCAAKDTEAGKAMLKQMHEMKDTICNCKDAACMVAAGKAMEEYGASLEKSKDQISAGQQKEAEQITKDITACSEKVQAAIAAAPPSPPPGGDKPHEPGSAAAGSGAGEPAGSGAEPAAGSAAAPAGSN